MRLHRRGSTLIELLVSLFVLSTAFFSLLGLLSTGYRATVQARDTAIATQLARESLEQSRKNDYAVLASLPESTVTITGMYEGKSYRTPFKRRLDVTSGLGGSGKLLTSIVRWQSDGVWHQVEVRTLVAAP